MEGIDGTEDNYRRCKNIDLSEAVADTFAQTRESVIQNLIEDGYQIIQSDSGYVRAMYDANGEKVPDEYRASFNVRIFSTT